MSSRDRQELARCQTWLSHLHASSRDRASLRARVTDLLRHHGEQWAGPRAQANWKRIDDEVDETKFEWQVGPVFGEDDQWQFQHGQLEICTTSANDFLAHGQIIRDNTNLQRLTLYGVGGQSLEQLYLSRIEKYERLKAPEVILENERQALEKARQRCPIEKLLNFEPLQGLKDLRFESLGLFAEELEAFVNAPFMKKVEKFYIYQFSDSHRAAFEQMGQLNSLVDLDWEFRSDGCGDRGIDVGDEHDAAVLAGSAGLGNLQALRLRYHEIGDRGLLALVGSPNLKQLKTLDVRGNYSSITDTGLVQLAKMPKAGRLKQLNLSQAGFSNLGTIALARSAHFNNLRDLYLAPSWESYATFQNISGRDFIFELCRSSSLPALCRLDISHQMIGDEGIRALANSPRFENFQSLGLAHQGMSDEGLLALAHSPYVPRLQELHLKWNDFSDRALARFCRSPIVKSIEVLSLSLTPQTGILLANSRFDNLYELRLDRIDESILQPLAESEALPLLRRLVFQSGNAPDILWHRKKHPPIYLLRERA